MRAESKDGQIKIYDAFKIKESIKEIEGWSFSAEDKAWCVPVTDSNAALLQLMGVELCENLCELIKQKAAATRIMPSDSSERIPVRATPYKHQQNAFNFAMRLFNSEHKGVAILADMGTGKTLITIGIVGALQAGGKVRRLLVISPKSITSVWQQEFKKFADYDYTLCVLEGDTLKKADTVRNMTGSALQVIVVNYESAWRLESELTKWQPDMVVCDESSKIKNPQAKRAKAVHGFGNIARYKAILTGTPITNNPLDFFSQYKFVESSVFGLSFYKFRARYAIAGGFQQREIIGYRHLGELVEKAHSIAFRIKIEDAVELPDKIDDIRLMELEPKAKEIYNSVDRDSYAQLMQGEITTTNILTRLLRLSQCTGGFIKDDLGEVVQASKQRKTRCAVGYYRRLYRREKEGGGVCKVCA